MNPERLTHFLYNADSRANFEREALKVVAKNRSNPPNFTLNSDNEYVDPMNWACYLGWCMYAVFTDEGWDG